MDTTGSVTWTEILSIAGWLGTVLLFIWWLSRRDRIRRQERRRCAAICEAFVRERDGLIHRLQREGAHPSDVRLQWLDCKRSEAARCVEAILREGRDTDV